jgi:7-cyano-7-deazaguanine synthase in queuosine biosynthesis
VVASFPVGLVVEYTVVVNDCAAPQRLGIKHVRFTRTAHGESNFTLNYNELVDGLPRQLTDIEQDWLDIFGALFAADCICERGRDQDWNRSIHLYIPCRRPDYWQRFAISLQELFGQLTYDNLVLHFKPEENPLPPPRQKKQAFRFADCIALFSGGMDSFVGSLLLQKQGRFPMLVSHSLSSAARRAQRHLFSVLTAAGAVGSRATILAQRKGQGRSEAEFGSETSQRSRSLLFLAAASLVAAVLKVREVYINENGVLAVHVPMTPARLGSYSTRTAWPALLERFGQTATDALGTQVEVHNNLLHLTKPEVAGEGIRLGHTKALAETISCWSIGRTNRHCGWCVPCLIRRVACEYHAIPDTAYESHPFDGIPESDTKAKDNLGHLVMLAQAFTTRSDEDLLLDYPELVYVGQSIKPQEVLDLYRRWGEQAVSVLQTHAFSAELL